MNVKYRHASEPERVKIYDTDKSYRNAAFLGSSRERMSMDEWAEKELKHFEQDKEKGVILEFEVVDDATAEKIRNQQTFDFYRKRLVADCGGFGRFRFNAIEYMCRAPKIDPVEMAVALKKDGFAVVFDDSSISYMANDRKRRAVERAFTEATKVGSVDGLIANAAAAAREVNQGRDSVMQELVKE